MRLAPRVTPLVFFEHDRASAELEFIESWHDDPGFVRGLFGWIKSHRRVRMVMYNQGSHPSESPFELSRYPRSAAVLRHELSSPLFAPVAPEFS